MTAKRTDYKQIAKFVAMLREMSPHVTPLSIAALDSNSIPPTAVAGTPIVDLLDMYVQFLAGKLEASPQTLDPNAEKTDVKLYLSQYASFTNKEEQENRG